VPAEPEKPRREAPGWTERILLATALVGLIKAVMDLLSQVSH
jgi:hypothetical protein